MPKQTKDITGDPVGIAYTADGQTWQVAKGVSVYGNQYGVGSEFLESTLKNKGAITGNGAGVVFDGNGAATSYLVKNTGKGTIKGGEAAVAVIDSKGAATVDNKGSIKGMYAGALFDNVSTDVTIKNKGTISGAFMGVTIDADHAGSKGTLVDNHGKVVGGLIGIQFDGAVDYAATVNNHKGAVIKGEGAAILSGARLDLKNDGKIAGSVMTWEGADKIVNKGKMGDVSLGAGNDIFKMKGNGKAGMIDTGEGNDLVVLGKNADSLLFASELDALTNVDTVKKFKSGQDTLLLNLDIFTEVGAGKLSKSQFHQGTAAADADDRIIYDKKTGALYYDADGSGAGAQVQFADLGAGTKLKASDIKAGYYTIDFLLS